MVETVAGQLAISIGFSIATTLVQAALAPKPNRVGPRLDDHSVQTTGEGQTKSILNGTVRVSGHLIWTTEEAEEIKSTQRVGKGGLFGGGTNTTFTYRRSFAMALGEAVPANAQIERIYADKQLIYDASDDGTVHTRMPGLVFRFHRGLETQLSDPTIEADTVARLGANTASAYRGTAYVLFYRFPISKFQNRIPEIEFIVATNASSGTRTSVAFETGGFTFTNNYERHYVYDPDRDIIYSLNNPLSSTCRILAHNATTGTLLASANLRDLVDNAITWTHENAARSSIKRFGPIGGATGPWLYVRGQDTSSAINPVIVVDKATLARASMFGELQNDGGKTTPTQMSGAGLFPVTHYAFSLIGPTGVPVRFLLGGGNFNSVTESCTFLLKFSGDNISSASFVWGNNDEFLGVPVGAAAAAQDGETVRLYMAHRNNSINDTGTTTINAMTVGVSAYYDNIIGTIGVTEFATLTTLSGGAQGNVILTVDPTDGHLLYQADGEAGKINTSTGAKIWSETGAVVSQYHSADTGHWRLPPTYWPIKKTARQIQLRDPAAGTLLDTFNWSDTFSGGTFSDQNLLWDDENFRVYLPTDRDMVYGANVNVAGIPLADLVEALATRGDLTAADLDLSQLADTVDGYAIQRAATIRETIEPLTLAFNFDLVPAGNVIKAVVRDGVADVVVDADDLVPFNEGDTLRRISGQELDTPAAVAVTYIDADRDYDRGAQQVRRTQAPTATMGAVTSPTIELPIVLTPAEGIAIAWRLLVNADTGRTSYEVQLPPSYCYITPGDVLQIDQGSRSYLGRVERALLGVNRVMSVELTRDGPWIYENPPPPVIGAGHIAQEVVGVTPLMKPIVIDGPLLRDTDSTDRSTGVLYATAVREITETRAFRSTSILLAQGNAEYLGEAVVNSEPAWGFTTTALPDHDPLDFSVQPDSVTVRMISGGASLASATQADMIEGANTAAIRNDALDEWEIISFQDVVDNGDGTYTLSGMVRGRRGSEPYATGHLTGETFVLLTEATVDGYYRTPSRIASSDFVIAVPNGGLIDEAIRSTVTYSLNSLRPYAPVELTATTSGSDIVIGWTRRTRVSGAALNNATSVPLSEDSESYSIDILDGPDGSVLRTLTATTNSVTYTSADITTDFGSPPATLTVKPYQVSAQYGRGATIEQTAVVN